MNQQSATIYVVDDETAVLKALTRLLSSAGFEVKPYNSPAKFLAEYNPQTPGCLILDISMPELSGLDVQDKLTASGPGLPIVFLTASAEVPASVKALKNGAVDYLCKPADDEALLAAVNAALKVDQATRKRRAELNDTQMKLNTLTAREREVLTYVISGRLNKQIADELHASEKTVKVHRARVMHKMEVESVAELVRLAEHAGIAPAPFYH